jgi:ribose transport system substrate-binding protein
MTHPAYSEDKNLNIVFIPKSSDQDFWIFMRDGVDRAVRETGNIALTWRGPRYNDDTDSQISIVQAYTRPGVDAIVIAPTDRERLVGSIRKATERGIKVIVVDSAVDGNFHQNFITTDNSAGGKLAARRMIELLNGHGRVAVYRTVAGSASTDDRANGFIDYIKENSPKITIIADEYGGGSRGKSLRSAVALLKRIPKVDGIFAVNESSSDGMLRALRNAGLAGQVRYVGFDATTFLLEGLEKQEIDGLVIQNPRQMGYLAIKAAVAAVNNTPMKDRTVFTDTTMVTHDNFQNPEIKSLLVP